jgi:hypothetical protein
MNSSDQPAVQVCRGFKMGHSEKDVSIQNGKNFFLPSLNPAQASVGLEFINAYRSM